MAVADEVPDIEVAPPLAPMRLSATPPKEGSGPTWVRLTSGEWLKASVESFEHNVLEVDSDKLDVLEIDWADVDALWVPDSHVWVRPDRSTAIGPAVLVDGILRVRTAEGHRGDPEGRGPRNRPRSTSRSSPD